MKNKDIEIQRAAGDITLVLKEGTKEEKESLFKMIEQVAGKNERNRIEKWVTDGMPGA